MVFLSLGNGDCTWIRPQLLLSKYFDVTIYHAIELCSPYADSVVKIVITKQIAHEGAVMMQSSILGQNTKSVLL
jgi:hypothetical protein